MRRRLEMRHESWPVRGGFTISRGTVTAVELVVVGIMEDGITGRGECRPYPRYGESVPQTLAMIEAVRERIEAGARREELLMLLPAGAARNALDAALWDLEAKRTGLPAWRLAGLPEPEPLEVSYTLSLDTPERMAEAARAASDRPILKLKLGGEGDVARVAAVRAAAPDARLIVDANEAWTPDLYREAAPVLASLGVELIEQPFPADRDDWLDRLERPVPLCADESCHDATSLERLAGRYDVVNLKLDKAGGLTEGLRTAMCAEELGLGLMVGCMVATSLAMAPAVLLAQLARWCDLDGPLLLARDREPGLVYRDSMVLPPTPTLWG
ncbi:N-acetyl-D-Glu racemase DgcA [Benzoatithermus flavus]|uniref:Dipeptide epimerase n=1 Tax=Benzoatithermus flavus TaxID=3108223 RepID=A0ABU8XT41_9PROT